MGGRDGSAVRVRNPSFWRKVVHPNRRIFPRRPRAGWVPACLGLAAVLGAVQFAWIEQSRTSERQAAMHALFEPLRGSIDQLLRELDLLMRIFGPHADFEPSDRSRSYWHRKLGWHAIAGHGLAVKRILFYDTPSSGKRQLSELGGSAGGISAAVSDENLKHALRHIDSVGFSPGQPVAGRWLFTWMFDPRSMVLFRPITRADSIRSESSEGKAVAGYLMLELDLGFIRDTVIPEILSKQFRFLNQTNGIAVGIMLDGQTGWLYEPSEIGKRSRATGYSVRSIDASHSSHAGQAVDRAIPFPLEELGVSRTARRHGAIQRIRMGSVRSTLVRENARQNQPSLGLEAGVVRALPVDDPSATLLWPSTPPRVFVTGVEPRTLVFLARQHGIPYVQIINDRHERSVAIGVVVLALLVGAMAIVAVSERKIERKAEMQIDAAISQSHQLRNPVMGIATLADNMIHGALGADDKAIRYGHAIRTHGQRLREIVERTMKMATMNSRLKSGSLDLIDVSRIARDAFEEARPMIERAGFEAECSCAEGLPKVSADAQALAESLSELLGNAVKYGLPGRWIGLETAESAGPAWGREVLIRVKDRGQGIPASEARTVFEPYYRAAAVAGSQISGSGLGLPLVYGMVKAMGGKLTMETKEGHGSEFTIHLPVRP